MSTAELIVELVLTGLLMLAALVLPVSGFEALRAPPETTMPVAIALGFVLGVVVDRCADSILARWEAALRCRFTWDRRISKMRDATLGGAEANDPFPEDYFRMRFMMHAPDGLLRSADLLRIRIRMARSAAFLAPALTTSAVFALLPESLDALRRFLPALHLVYFAIAFALSYVLEKPRTDKAGGGKSRETVEARFWPWVLESPATIWLVLESATAFGVAPFVAAGHGGWRVAAAIAASGLVATALASFSWARISKTYMELLFRFCLLEEKGRDALKQAFLGASGREAEAKAAAAAE